VAELRVQGWALWRGEGSVLPFGARVLILAIDPECTDPRGAAWVRWSLENGEFARYRSCDLTDLEAEDD
jgi:hypothetical protein